MRGLRKIGLIQKKRKEKKSQTGESPSIEATVVVYSETSTTVSSKKLTIPTGSWLNGAGFIIVGYILNDAKKIGRENSLMRGKRTEYFEENCSKTNLFSNDGILSSYRKLGKKTVGFRFNKFEKDVESKYYNKNHSDDTTGEVGEDMPQTISLCLQWFEYRDTHDVNHISKNNKKKQWLIR